MSYTPLDSCLLTSSVLACGPDVVAVWALILASADKLGETDMQPTAAASLLRIDDERAEKAFRVLSEPDPRSKNLEHEGRRIIPTKDGRWSVVSHQKYQVRASRAKATESNRRYEERKKAEVRSLQVQAEVCDEPRCGGAAEHALGGRRVCHEHAFTGREPGIEG